MRVLSVGEVLWDLFSDKELLGGAPLNFSVNAARLGHEPALITAVGEDERGRQARKAMRLLHVDTRFVREVSHAPTGVAVVSTNAEGEPEFRIPRPAAFDYVTLDPEALEQIRSLKPDWLYVGTLAQQTAQVEELTHQIVHSSPEARCFYDMNLRTNGWNLPLVQRLCQLASVLKLNEFEAHMLGSLTGSDTKVFSLETFCKDWAARYDIECICVTLGPAGSFVYEDGEANVVSGYPIMVDDTVGAGDAFAAAFLHGYSQGWPILQTARFANAAGAIVASRPGATPVWSLEECLNLASSTLDNSAVEQS